jgi:uncharacterized protein (DUF4415 family)
MSESKKSIGSNLAKVDAHVITPEEYDDAPELDDAFFENAIYEVNGVVMPQPTKAGRPRVETPKVHTGLRLDADVLDHFKAAGPGWQTRINATLRAAMERAR